MKKFTKTSISSAIAFCIPFMAQAQDVQELAVTEAKTVSEENYKVAETSNIKFTQSVANTPKTINVVSAQMLEDQGVTSLNDALRNVAGVSTFGGGEGGGGVISASDKVSIRGFDARSNIYVDGIRDIAGYSRDLFNYEQVEVIKGASSSLDGRSTGGGSLNLSTKRAHLSSFKSVTGQADSFGTARVTADINQKLSDNAAARVNLLYTDGGDVFDNGEENYQTLGAAVSGFYKVNNDTDLSLDVFLMEQDNTPVLGLPFLTASAAQATGKAEGPISSDLWDQYYSVKGRDFEEVSTQMYTLTINHQLNDTVSLRSQTRLGSNEKQSVLGRPWWNSDDEAHLLNATRTQALDEETDLFVTQLDSIFSFDTGNVSHDLVIGAEYATEEKTSFGVTSNYTYTDANGNTLDNPTIDPFNYSNNILLQGGVERNGENTHGDASTIAFYAFDTIKLGSNLQLDVNARYDSFDISGSACGRRSGCASGLDAEDSFLSYGAAVSYLFSNNGNVYLSYSNAQQPPGTELALSTTSAVNAIDPENAKTLELGTKWELFDQQLLVTAAVFSTTKDVVDSESITDSNGDSVTNYYLTGEQESKGFEIGAVGKLSQNLSLSASFVSLDTEITQDFTAETVGNGLQGAPDETASVWLSYAALEDKLNVGGGLNYNSGETFWRRNTAYFTVDSYTTAYFMASYQFSDALKLQLNVDNLTDEEYVTDYSAKGHFLPGNPRSVSVYAKYSF